MKFKFLLAVFLFSLAYTFAAPINDQFFEQYKKVFETQLPRDVRKLEFIFAQLSPPNATEVSEMQNAYTVSRLWTEAAAFQKSHADFNTEVFPVVTKNRSFDEKLPAYASVVSAEKIHLQNFDLFHGNHFVIVSRIGCHFSDLFFESVKTNKSLFDRIKKLAVIVTIQTGSLGVTELYEWNKANPELPINIIYLQSTWGIDTRATPTFYFFRDGKIVYSFNSWPKEGNLEKLNTGIGLLEQ